MTTLLSNISNEALFILCLGLVLFFACMYWLSDAPAEKIRRQKDPHEKTLDLEFLDYFIFSISVWTTVGGGASRFAIANWEVNTRYVYTCQLLTLLFTVLVSSINPMKYLF